MGPDDATQLMLSALGATVDLDVDEGAEALVEALRPLLRPRAGRPSEDGWYVERHEEGWRFRPGLARSRQADDPLALVGPLLDQLNRLVSRRCSAVAVHAGAVVIGGRGVLLAGPEESGKSTLTTGLVRAGAGYLGDEAIGIDPAVGLLPYAKPISLDPGSQHLFPELADRAIRCSGRDGRWTVPASAISEGAIRAGAPLDHVVFPQYEANATSRLTAISRAAATYQLTSLTFRFQERPLESLDTLAAAVGAARSCHTLIVGDLAGGVDAVLGLVRAR